MEEVWGSYVSIPLPPPPPSRCCCFRTFLALLPFPTTTPSPPINLHPFHPLPRSRSFTYSFPYCLFFFLPIFVFFVAVILVLLLILVLFILLLIVVLLYSSSPASPCKRSAWKKQKHVYDKQGANRHREEEERRFAGVPCGVGVLASMGLFLYVFFSVLGYFSWKSGWWWDIGRSICFVGKLST